MQIVIDANVIIAMLIKPGLPLELFYNDGLEIFAPKIVWEEVENNLITIHKKSDLNFEELYSLLYMIKKYAQIIPDAEFVEHKSDAINICPDLKDIQYFALALYLKCPIWSNEKKLREQDKIKVYATHELIDLFKIKS